MFFCFYSGPLLSSECHYFLLYFFINFSNYRCKINFFCTRKIQSKSTSANKKTGLLVLNRLASFGLLLLLCVKLYYLNRCEYLTWFVLFVQVSYLGLIGGMNVKQTTRRIMSSLFTNPLAMQYNFMGHGAKHAYSDLQLKDVINGLVCLFYGLPWLQLACFTV